MFGFLQFQPVVKNEVCSKKPRIVKPKFPGCHLRVEQKRLRRQQLNEPKITKYQMCVLAYTMKYHMYLIPILMF